MRRSTRKVNLTRRDVLRQRRQAEYARLTHEYEAMVAGKRRITSTRQGTSGSDAHRDMDGFDQDEELRRFELAVEQGKFTIAARLAANLNEHAQRGGSLPAPWLGPRCMRTKSDLESRMHESLQAEKALGYRNRFA